MITQRFLGKSFAFASAVFLVNLMSSAPAQATDPAPDVRIVKSEVQGSNRREILSPQSNSTNTPLISFIDSPTAACYQPDVTQDVCYINWY
jgi:hypothetical protein